MRDKIVLIDGHSILNRAFYGLPELTNAEGLHTNAVYGFLNIMFKQMKALKDEEPILFNETLLLMDLNKTPDSLELNEEAALKITATELVENEKTQKKKFHLVDNEYLNAYESTKNDSELMAQLFGEQQNERVYSIELNEMDMEKPKSKGGKNNDL